MRILVAPDSFKGSLTSYQAARIIAETLSRYLPEAEIIECPLADGGEGTFEILAPIIESDICLIESAQLIGLNQAQMQSLNVMMRGSAQLGQAIIDGLDSGKRDFVIALGGSATNDGGLGMLLALGMKAFDTDENPVESNLSGLLSVKRIDLSGLDSRLSESRLTVLSDVVSPLCGKNGATAVYGPQKGVQVEEVERVDRAMELYALKCSHAFGFDASTMPGAGAAGGLGFALMLLGGKMVSGAEYVMNKTGFYKALVGADWVITGEGCSDAQTLQGKLPLKVAQAARSKGAKVLLLSGSVGIGSFPELEKEFDLVISAKPEGMDVDQAVQQAEKLLNQATERFISSSNSSSLF